MSSVSVRRPVLVGAVTGAAVMLLVLLTGIRGGVLLVPLFVGASVGLAAAHRGAAAHTALAAGVGAALLCIGLAAGLAFVALVFLVGSASTTQPGLGDRVLALLVAAAGVTVAVRSVWPAVGVAMVAVACLVLVPPLGRPIEVHPAHGLAAPDYPPTPRDDPRRGLPLAGGTVSLTKSKIFYINGEGGDPTHRLIARWRPPLGLVPEQTPITDLCGPIGQPCPRWFLDDPKRSVAPADEPQLGPRAGAGRPRAGARPRGGRAGSRRSRGASGSGRGSGGAGWCGSRCSRRVAPSSGARGRADGSHLTDPHLGRSFRDNVVIWGRLMMGRRIFLAGWLTLALTAAWAPGAHAATDFYSSFESGDPAPTGRAPPRRTRRATRRCPASPAARRPGSRATSATRSSPSRPARENPPNETAERLDDGDVNTKWLAFEPTGWVRLPALRAGQGRPATRSPPPTTRPGATRRTGSSRAPTTAAPGRRSTRRPARTSPTASRPRSTTSPTPPAVQLLPARTSPPTTATASSSSPSSSSPTATRRPRRRPT